MIVGHCRLIIDSLEIAQHSKNPATKLSRLNFARRLCSELVPYAAKGIPTLTKPPADVAHEIASQEAKVVEEAIRSARFAARERAKDAATDAGRLNGYAKAIASISKLLDETADAAEIEAAILSLRAERDGLRFDLLCRKAEVAAAKGQNKKAADLYIEAIMAIKHDETPDSLQRERIEKAERRVSELRQS